NYRLKRVYYSGYVPISEDTRLPAPGAPVPMLREHRLYQTDWLMRVYGFERQDILNESNPHLDLALDPKAGWALRNLHLFPVDINRADREMLLRVPGIGFKSVDKILHGRRFRRLSADHLKQMGVLLSRARHFITCAERPDTQALGQLEKTQLRSTLLKQARSKYAVQLTPQISLFGLAEQEGLLTPSVSPDLNTLFAPSSLSLSPSSLQTF
ncbi:MAG TPA: hypothetical protein PKD78_15675, partial [Saprospiraceae bacterium]|nr:hypothetical protein [Saprospiraceae bacterium]